MNPKYSVYVARVKPHFEPIMFKPARKFGKATGLMGDDQMAWGAG